MTVNLIKLSVGSETVDSLRAWIDTKLDMARRAGRKPEYMHTTRMVPKRIDDLLDGGSMYWVIKGFVQARQKLIDVRPFTDTDGITRCHLVMDPNVHLTEMQPRRPFQGWRYLRIEDAPRDLAGSAGGADMPLEMRRDLSELGLI
ncbi:MAG: DUF1489 family protein [Pseudomonadota bacterium]